MPHAWARPPVSSTQHRARPTRRDLLRGASVSTCSTLSRRSQKTASRSYGTPFVWTCRHGHRTSASSACNGGRPMTPRRRARSEVAQSTLSATSPLGPTSTPRTGRFRMVGLMVGLPGHLPGRTILWPAQGDTLTPRGERNRRSRCPVCGSRKVMPSLGRLGTTSTKNDGGMPRFSWRCRACRTSMRAHAQRAELWRPRRPLSNWLHRRAATRV
jgi:hypothetical protein